VPPCWTASEARARGTLLSEWTVTPGRIQWKDTDIEFEDAWTEEAARLEYYLVWFPYYRKVGRTFLCFRLKRGNEVFRRIGREPFFLLGDERKGVGAFLSTDGDVLFFDDVADPDVTSARMSLVSSWDDSRAKDIGFTRKPKQP
jgi:hypothetical protein